MAQPGAGEAAAGAEGYRQLSSMPQWQPGSRDRRQISGMISAVPVLGQLKMLQEALTGRDLVAGTCLGAGERLLNGGASGRVVQCSKSPASEALRRWFGCPSTSTTTRRPRQTRA